jgi:hypothetical protein
MADTIRNEADLLALYVIGGSGLISAQDGRDLIVSIPSLAINAGNASAQRTALGLVIGTDVAAQSSLASYLPLAGGTMTGTITSTLGTLTGSSTPAFSSTVTWNNAATTFTHILVNLTNTASNAASMFLDFQLAGTSQFKVLRTGELIGPTDSNNYSINTLKLGNARMGEVVVFGTNPTVAINASSAGIVLGSARRLGFSSLTDSANTSTFVSAVEVAFGRNAAGVAEVNNGTNGTYRDLRLRYVRTEATTVASLVAAGTAGAGARSYVTDANATTYLSVVAGGGSNKVPVFSDGTNWLIG